MKKVNTRVKPLQTGGDGTAYYGEEVIDEKVMTKKDIKKRDEIADAISTKDMKDRYGDKNVKYAIATKIVMDKKKKKKEDIKEAVPLLVKAAMLGAGMVAKKALTGKKKKKEKEEVGPTIMVTKVVEELDKKDKPFVKKLVKKLRKGSKTHAKQADDLEKAMNEDITDEALTIQDWNIDDIKFTEIETVDIIKAKPLLGEKYSFIKHAFGKNIIRATGVDKAMGQFPRLSSKGARSLIKNKSQLAIKGFKDAIQKVKDLKKMPDAPITFPRDKQIIKVKKKTNPNAIFPTKANVKIMNEIISQDGISTKNPIKKKFSKEHYDWRAQIDEDWQKVNRKDKTDGLSKAAVKAYRRENPGSKLQTAVTKDPKKLKKGSKSAKRRLSFCRRMKGMKKKLTSAKTRRDPDSRINKALRRWNC